MAQSDDLTTHAQTWRDDGQGQYNPEQVAYFGDEISQPAQQQAYPPNTALAEQPQHNAGFQNPYDAPPALPPTSYDATPAGQQYHQPAQPVTYQADPLTHPPTQPYEAQPSPAPQAYAEAPLAFGQAQPAAVDHYAAQAQTQPGHEQAAVVYTNYTAPPQMPVEPSHHHPVQSDPYAIQAGGQATDYAPLQYDGTGAGFAQQRDPSFADTQAGMGFQTHHQPQPLQDQPETSAHDPYAFPQGGDDYPAAHSPAAHSPAPHSPAPHSPAQGMHHEPQTGGAFLDPTVFSQPPAHNQAFSDAAAFRVQQTGPAPLNPAGMGGHYDPVTQPDLQGYAQQPQGYDQRFEQSPGYDQRFEQPDPGFHDGAMQGGGMDIVAADAALEPTRSRRGLIVIGALVAAIGIGGALGFAYKYSNDSGTRLAGAPPMIKASRTPSKEAPKKAGGKAFANQENSIYTRLETNRAAERSTTRLVPREESVTGLNGAALRSSTSGQTSAGGTRITSLQSGQRVNVPGVRKVRTRQVNPDGSFVVPGTSVGQGGTSSFSIPGITIGSLPASGTTAPATIPARKAVKASKKITASLPKSVASIPKPKAAIPPRRVASLSPAVTGSGAGLGFVVQVSARRSRIDALAAFADLQQRHSSALNAKQPDIQEVDLGTRGKWYRVRIGPPGSKNAAYNLCNKLKKSGLKDCIVKSY